jgi:hypothetical protein
MFGNELPIMQFVLASSELLSLGLKYLIQHAVLENVVKDLRNKSNVC